MGSNNGVETAWQEVSIIYQEIKKIVEETSISTPSLRIKAEQVDRKFLVTSNNFSLIINWVPRYSNTLNESSLLMFLYEGRNSLEGHYFPDESQLLKRWEYNFDLNAGGGFGWRKTKTTKRFFNSKQLADEVIKILLNQVQKAKLNR